MNHNRNKPKQLDSRLKCTASESCCRSVEQDLNRPDKTIASLLEEDTNEDKERKQASD